MIAPLTQWTCDGCGQDVSGPDGQLTFRNEAAEPFLAYEFRIVHPSSCQRANDNAVTEELHTYLGEDGLTRLLAYLTAGPGRAREPGLAVRDIDEFVDLIRRLHTPYYEQARERFTDPQIAQALRSDDRWHPYRPANLRRLAEPAGSAAR